MTFLTRFSRNILSRLALVILWVPPTLHAAELVVDQDGKSRDFFQDVVGDGQQVLVNFVYTHCQGVCPRSGQHFKMMESVLGEHLGKDVKLISVSIDPERDTPESLKNWANHYDRHEGWTLVTGDRKTIDAICEQLVGGTILKEGHSPFLAIRNKSGVWQRIYGLSTPQQILAKLDAPLNQIP